jgi:hypothetical protein
MKLIVVAGVIVGIVKAVIKEIKNTKIKHNFFNNKKQEDLKC